MASASFTQTSFLGGEWSQKAQGRVDRFAYKSAMNVCENGLPVETGAWVRRPGTRLAAHSKNGSVARLLSFEFQQNEPYTIELTRGFARFYQGENIVFTNDSQTVSSISTASPAVVTTTSAHGWVTGDTVMFSGLGLNNPLLQNRQFIIGSAVGSIFTLIDALTGVNLDGATIGAFVSGTVSRIYELKTPYVDAAWATVRLVQADGAAILLHSEYPPQVLVVDQAPVPGVSFAVFTLAELRMRDGPYLDPDHTGATLIPSATSGIINLTISFPTWNAVKPWPIESLVVFATKVYVSLIDQNTNNQPDTNPTKWELTSANIAMRKAGNQIGRQIRLFSEPAAWASGTAYVAGDAVKYNSAYWTCLTNHTAAPGNNPSASATHWGVYVNGANWTWGKIVGVNGLLTATTPIGDMTNTASAIDTITVKTAANCAHGDVSVDGYSGTLVTYTGTDFGTGVKVGRFLIHQSSDRGFFAGQSFKSYFVQFRVNASITIYASNTAPTGATNGTILGSFTFPPITFGANAGGTAAWQFSHNPISIANPQKATAFRYYWATYTSFMNHITSEGGQVISIDMHQFCAQLEFFTPQDATTAETGVKVQIVGPSLLYTTPISVWRLGLFNQIDGWPTCGGWHEGRLWLAGAVANRFDASRPNPDLERFVRFNPTEFDTGTVTSDNAISYTLNTDTVNTALWLKSTEQGMLMGTERSEWLIRSTALNAPLTPTNIQAHPTTRIGSALAQTAEPVQGEQTLVFLQRYARRVMELFPDVNSGRLSAPNLNADSEHMTTNQLDQLAYQHSVSPVLWARGVNGVLLGCSYKRDNLSSAEGPAFAAWHRHSLGNGRLAVSIAPAASAAGTVDTLVLATTPVGGLTTTYPPPIPPRPGIFAGGLFANPFDLPIISIAPITSGGACFIEFLQPLSQESDLLTAAWYLDAAIVPSSAFDVNITGTVYRQFNGLWPLNGETCTVFAGGLDLGDWPVVNGSVQVPYVTSNALFTQDFVLNYVGTLPVIVGLKYTSKGQIVAPKDKESGAVTGPATGKLQRIHRFAAKLVNTIGISFGTSFSRMHPALFRTPGGTAFAANTMFSGTYRDAIDDDYSLDARIAWQITRPFPATVANISGALHTQDL